jgi:hypothetical protein
MVAVWAGEEAKTVKEKAETELFQLRHLSVGREAPDIEGEDQDGKRFKLSDYAALEEVIAEAEAKGK